MPRSALTSSLLALLLAACGGAGGASQGSTGPAWGEATSAAASSSTGADPDAAVTYYRDIKPILDARCVRCHVAGDITPLALTTLEEVRPFAEALAAVTADGSMPPWPPDAACRGYAHDRSLGPGEREALRAWSELGAPAGDPADAPPGPGDPGDEPVVHDVELVIDPPYQPNPGVDERRCFLFDWPKDQVSFVTALDVAPGDRRIVHHAIAYAIPPEYVDLYRAYDEVDPNVPGYPCFGGPDPGGASPLPWLGAWTPGTVGGAFPAGTGVRVLPGSLLALQIHYRLRPGMNADRSRLRLRTAASVERPAVALAFTDPEWITGLTPMLIPAGTPDVVHAYELDLASVLPLLVPDGPFVPGGAFVVRAAALHQNLLGTRSDLRVLRSGGAQDCVLDVPRWDSDWEGSYELLAPVAVAPGDRVRLECHWDNSAGNQPIVQGAPQAPRDVLWGEDSRDEMCLGVLYITAE